MTPDEARAAIPGWTLERVGAEVYGCPAGGWRARRGRWVRGGYRLAHVVEQVREHEAWERSRRPVQLSLWSEEARRVA